MPLTPDTDAQLRSAREALVEELRGTVPEPRVRQRFDQVERTFDGVRVRTFLPVLVAKQTKRSLLR